MTTDGRMELSQRHPRRSHGDVVRASALVAGMAIALLASACDEPETPMFPPPGDAVSVASPDTVGPIRFEGRNLVDATGRVVLIHGVNVVRKDKGEYFVDFGNIVGMICGELGGSIGAEGINTPQ